MPIYEFACPRCRRIFSFLSRRVNPSHTPACPKCGAALHCCKQCTYFEPSTRFQCLKPVPVRISPKDTANTCELFKARVTVAPYSVLPQRKGAPACPLLATSWDRVILDEGHVIRSSKSRLARAAKRLRARQMIQNHE